MSPSPSADAASFIDDLAAFITASPSSFHAARTAADRLTEAGFVLLREDEPWHGVAGRHVVVRDGAVIAWVAPKNATPLTPVKIVGTHTDSPAFKLKPKSTTSAAGWLQAGVELYGGGLPNSNLDRELELAGRLVTRDGREYLTRTGPLLRVPQLAPHLDRGAHEKLTLDKQQHLNPVWGLGVAEDADLLAVLAAGAGVDPAEVGGYDIVSCDTQPPRIFGLDGALFAAPRLDNLLSTHAALRALLTAPSDGESIRVFAAFDHEEVGSSTRSGACGPFLAEVLARIAGALGADADQRARAYASSLCISSDVGHSIHPNYQDKHDPVVRPVAGQGPILKINAMQRYATDAVGAAAWASLCATAGVPTQDFVSNNDSPCGSTTGPLTATRLGIRTVDVGVPILSMHSARELCAVADPHYLYRALSQFYRD